MIRERIQFRSRPLVSRTLCVSDGLSECRHFSVATDWRVHLRELFPNEGSPLLSSHVSASTGTSRHSWVTVAVDSP